MKYSELIEEILNIKELLARPPVLLDIGASGFIHPEWQLLSKHSICIAFEADERDMDYVVSADKGFRKLYVYKKIVSDRADRQVNFYLTKLPHCSSVLEPIHKDLERFSFYPYFEVEKIKKLPNITLPKVLRELNVDRVDWFKTDSQGIDLRLFKALGDKIISKVIIAEFEPGIIDAYKGEDKLHHVLSYMEHKPFWLSEMEVKGTYRLSKQIIYKYFKETPQHRYNLPVSSCWANPVYINTFETIRSKRDYLLGCVVSLLKKQYGFSLELVDLAEKHGHQASIFNDIKSFSIKMIEMPVIERPVWKSMIKKCIKKCVNKLVKS